MTLSRIQEKIWGSKLVEEEAALELEEASRYTVFQRERTSSVDGKLGNLKEQRDYLPILQKTIQGETSDTAPLPEAELKSVCAIVRMAEREEILKQLLLSALDCTKGVYILSKSAIHLFCSRVNTKTSV
jgi:hypothetical protein